jgi:hypothetical protein
MIDGERMASRANVRCTKMGPGLPSDCVTRFLCAACRGHWSHYVRRDGDTEGMSCPALLRRAGASLPGSAVAQWRRNCTSFAF